MIVVNHRVEGNMWAQQAPYHKYSIVVVYGQRRRVNDQARGGAKGGGIVHVDANERRAPSKGICFSGRWTKNAGRWTSYGARSRSSFATAVGIERCCDLSDLTKARFIVQEPWHDVPLFTQCRIA
jgi:hypothetical protein